MSDNPVGGTAKGLDREEEDGHGSDGPDRAGHHDLPSQPLGRGWRIIEKQNDASIWIIHESSRHQRLPHHMWLLPIARYQYLDVWRLPPVALLEQFITFFGEARFAAQAAEEGQPGSLIDKAPEHKNSKDQIVDSALGATASKKSA